MAIPLRIPAGGDDDADGADSFPSDSEIDGRRSSCAWRDSCLFAINAWSRRKEGRRRGIVVAFSRWRCLLGCGIVSAAIGITCWFRVLVRCVRGRIQQSELAQQRGLQLQNIQHLERGVMRSIRSNSGQLQGLLCACLEFRFNFIWHLELKSCADVHEALWKNLRPHRAPHGVARSDRGISEAPPGISQAIAPRLGLPMPPIRNRRRPGGPRTRAIALSRCIRSIPPEIRSGRESC